jgi:SAM-dependent methyltransferase
MRNFFRFLRPPARPAAPRAPVDGRVDGFHAGAIEGWAVNNVDPSQPVKVVIHQNGSPIGEAAANAFRDDLREAGIGLGHGNYAFCFPVPAEYRAVRSYSLSALVNGGIELRGSPVAVFETDEFPFRSAGAHVRDFLALQYLRGSGIEIGALDKPATVPQDTIVKYVDSKPSERLRDYYLTELSGHNVVHVDLVTDAHTLEGIADCSQDFVIANQVLEHLENTLQALQSMLRVVKKGGVVFLSLPDKRFTFDVDRPATRFPHVLEDYRSGAQVSRESHYREWIELVEKIPAAQVPERLNVLMNVLKYPIHFHAWTAFELFELFEQARTVLPYAYEIDCFKANEAEALFVLRRTI